MRRLSALRAVVTGVALLLAAVPSRLLAQATVRGTVVAARGGPLRLATVELSGRGARAVTDDRGRFRFAAVPAGTATLRVRLVGYRPADRTIVVPDTGTLDVSVALEPAAVYLNEVRVLAGREPRQRFDESAEVGALSLGGNTVRAIPAVGEADVLRAVQMLPGVLARNDYTAGYNVRGGEADQNLVLLDGIPVYNPFHLGGVFGTFIEPTVSDVTLLTGGFPATYGGRLSSVLDVTTMEEARGGIHGDVGVSVLASTAALGGALPSRGTSWNVAARRTYADQVVKAYARDQLPYHFRDEQLHVTQLMPGGGTLSFTGYDGRDVLNEQVFDENGFENESDTTFARGNYDLDWGNSVGGLTWRQPLGQSAAFTQRASYSRFSSTLDVGDGSRILSNALTDARLAGALVSQLGAHRVSVGYDLAQLRTRFYDRSPRTTVTLQSLKQAPGQGALYADDVWQLGRRLILRPGLRVEHVTGGADWSGVSPRAAVKFFATPDLAVTLAGGRVSQPVHSMRREDVPTELFDYWLAADRYIPVSTATHLVLGAERWWGASRFVRVEGFDKRYGDLVEPNPADDKLVRGDEFLRMDGRAYGVDVLLRQLETHALSGWIAYSWTVSSRSRGDTSWWATQDRRHNVNAVAAWRGPRGFSWGARFGYGSGTPYTPIVAELLRPEYDPTTGQYGSGAHRGDLLALGGDRNGARLPGYHRLDLGVSRRIVRPRAVLVPSLQLVNVYNRRNVFRYTWDFASAPPTRRGVSQLPIVPTIGLSVEF